MAIFNHQVRLSLELKYVGASRLAWFGADSFAFFSLSIASSEKKLNQEVRLKEIFANGLSEEICRIGSIDGHVGFSGCPESDTDVGLASLVNFTDCGLRDRKWRSR